MSPKREVLVFVEQGPDGALLPVSLECLTAGRRLSEALGCELAGLVMGHPVAQAAEEVSRHAVGVVYAADHPLLLDRRPEPLASAFLQVIERVKPRAVLMGDTLCAADLAPRLAFSLETGLVTDCVGLELEQGEILFRKPVFSSNVMAAYAFPAEPYLATLRSRAEAPSEAGASPVAEVVPVDVVLDPSAAGTELVRRVLEEEEGPALAAAEVVVAGGRGMGGPEGFERLSAIAGILDAAVGASRPPCDLGWASPKAQVGQTGEKVGPSLYLAVGISGATQHLAGMAGSGKIVAINKDPKANIFRVADYGVVGDQEEVLPAFQEALAELLG